MKPGEDLSPTSWVKKDQPTDVSTMAHYKDGGYEDVLEERRHTSDLKYAMKSRPDVPRYKYCKPRTPAEIKTQVLSSDRLRYTIEKISDSTKASKEEIMKEAGRILDDMAHNLTVGVVRSVAYFLIKVFKSIFSRIYVNKEGIQMLHRLLHEYPVLLMPTHRSYLDFLLVSYIFYEYDLPLPIIATAMDFQGMKFFSWVIRQVGGFYIRRAFGSDILYWAIFTEYVQTHLRNGDAPIEFFVEGTRSRTAKSYQPKIGMLSASLESYFKAELPDVMVVPISISYDRILEETIYAYELLGIPKPKESTAGLLKARGVLSNDYGSVHFHIDNPISIRLFSSNKIDRVQHALEPRYINNLTAQEKDVMVHLARRIVRQQQGHMVISPWALMASVLMQSREGILLKQLIKEVEWLKRQTSNLGAYVNWPGNTSSESVVQHYLSLHVNVISISDAGLIELKLVLPSHMKKPVADEVMLNAATNLILSSYRNQLLHVFVQVGMLSLVVNASPQVTMTMDDLYQGYVFLETLLQKEFVFLQGETKKEFEWSVLTLNHSGALAIKDNHVLVKQSINKYTTFFSQMFEPFLLGYWVLCQYFLSLPGDIQGKPLPRKPKNFTKEAQKVALRLLQENVIRHYEILSLDLLGNGLLALVEMGCMYKDKRADEPWVSPNHVAVTQLTQQIAKYVETPRVAMSNFTQEARRVALSAKL